MKPIVLTLDAGGTNFVFSAIQDNQQLGKSIHLPSQPHDLEKCIGSLINGFKGLRDNIDEEISAISFAFPGPADYPMGIIGNTPNFKAFNDQVPLGPILENEFNLPVFINNDGNLFAYGEALSGFLPHINKRIKDKGGIKQFKNLLGLTLGTGFGGGLVIDSQLVIGDSACGAEVHNLLNKQNTDWNAEESVSTRAIQRVYTEGCGLPFSDKLMPKDIADIANGLKEGNTDAAREAFRQFGEVLGNSIANITTLVDGLVVLGGGITAAWDLFAPSMFKEINRKFYHFTGSVNDRLTFKVFDLEDETTFSEFAKGKIEKLQVGKKTIAFDSLPRVGIGISKLGASHATSLGAYTFALQQLDK